MRQVIGLAMMLFAATLFAATMPVHAAQKPARKPVAAPRMTSPKDLIFRSILAEVRRDGMPAKQADMRAAISAVTINTDGIEDFQVKWESLSSPAWCGTGGCRYQLWLGSAAGSPRIVFDNQMRELTTRSVGGEMIFDFDFHGGVCGGYGAEACPASFAWDGTIKRMVERPTASGDGTIRMVQPIDAMIEKAPASVAARSAARKAVCVKAGGKPDSDTWQPLSIPDIDGDGVRDWALINSYCPVADDKPEIVIPNEILATAGHADRPAPALTASGFDVSVTTKPATVSTYQKSDACQSYSTEPEAKVCARTPMIWDAASGKLVAK